MSNKYIPHTEDDIQEMLKVSGVHTIDDLYQDIPEQVILKKEYDIPSAMSEIEIRKFIGGLSEKNKICSIFTGAGAYDHYSPSVISQIISRSEFLTAYTPYQAEISQGTLQYIFEFQSMMSELTGMPCCNASMYDGPTACAESMMMCVAAAKKKNKVLYAATLPIHVRRVLTTYAKFHGVNLVEIPEKDGVTDKSVMDSLLSAGDVAGVIVSQPNAYGIIEDFTGYAETIHAQKAIFVMYTDPSALAVLKTPGEWEADVACGDGQSLGIPLNYGGPYVGFMGSTKALERKLPGRIVGATHDIDGKRAYVLTLQAREQHIRREKANSNICSNQSLMALYVTIYMSLMGPKGLKEVNELSYSNSHYVCDELCKTGHFSLVYKQPFLKEFLVKTDLPVEKLQKTLLENGIFGGIELRPGELLFCVTESRTQDEIEQLLNVIKSML